MSTLTPEQIQAGIQMLVGLRERLLSMNIKLIESHSNGYIIAHEVQKRGLPFTADNALQVVNAILYENKLEWQPGFEPAKLKLQKQSQHPEKLVPKWEPELDREAKARAAEKADAATKASAENYRAARSAVAAYQPLRSGRNGSSIDYREQEETTKILKDYIDREEKRGVDGNAVLEKVAEYIQKRYEAIEVRSVRM